MTILTQRGQISVPKELRKAMQLQPGHYFRWEQISANEIRVVVDKGTPVGPLAVLGYARKIRKGPPRRTSEWMKELREGES